jgi:surface antigen
MASSLNQRLRKVRGATIGPRPVRRAAQALVAAGLLLAAGCADWQQHPKTAGGTVVGAGTGALIGAQMGSGTGKLATIAIGTLIGSVIGSEVGKSLDRADQLEMERTTQKTLETTPTGQASAWRNPDTGNQGTVTPVHTYIGADGQNCREYQQKITVGGRSQQGYGTACRQADGSWKIVQ